jgi:predicted metal-binding protein
MSHVKSECVSHVYENFRSQFYKNAVFFTDGPCKKCSVCSSKRWILKWNVNTVPVLNTIVFLQSIVLTNEVEEQIVASFIETTQS